MMRVYEPGMKITYDPQSKRVVVSFRGRIVVLPDVYDTESAALAAGESHCQRLGWSPPRHNRHSARLRAAWRD